MGMLAPYGAVSMGMRPGMPPYLRCQWRAAALPPWLPAYSPGMDYPG